MWKLQISLGSNVLDLRTKSEHQQGIENTEGIKCDL
jgi:hypothetical protein